MTELTYKEIQAKATELGIKKVVGIKKDELIAQIQEIEAAKAAAAEPEKKSGKGNLASQIYHNLAQKHPDWSSKRVYAVTHSILANKNKKVAEAVAEGADVATDVETE